MVDEVKHEVTVNKTRHPRDWWCECSCGQDWRIPYTRKGIHMDTGAIVEYEGDEERMNMEVKATTDKHLAYYERKKTEPD